MSAPFIGSVPAEIARIIFDYAEPLGEPVPCAPTEWERRIGTLPDGTYPEF